jgi:large repetitive protein
MKKLYAILLAIFLLPLLSRAQTGTHLHFDGSRNFVNLGNSICTTLDTLNTITVEAWVKPEINTGNGVIVGNYNFPTPNAQMQFLLRRDATTYTFWVNDGTGFKVVTTPESAVVVDTWQHVVGVWNGADLKIYIDGLLKETTTGVTGASFATTTNSMVIGVGFTTTNSGGVNNAINSERFKGSIEEVRIWSTAQTADDIAIRRFCELAGNEASLIRYYKFNQGIAAGTNPTITTLIDATTNANNGTLTNFALTGATSNWLSGSTVTSGSTIPTTPSVSTPVSYCINATATALTATGTSMKWYTAAIGGVGSSTAPTPTTTTAGNTSYWVTSSNANGCESARAEIVVTINAKPVVSITDANAICVGATTALSPTTGGTWASSNNAFATVTNAGVVSGVASSAPTFTFTQTSTGCPSLATAAVTVNAIPAAPSVSTPVLYAQNATASALTATGTSLLWYTASTGGTGSATAPTPSTTTVGTTSHWVSQTVSTCESPRAQIDVTVALPAATHLNFDGVNDYVNCGTNSMLNITSSISVEAWINRSSLGTDDCIIGKDLYATKTGYSFWVYRNNKVIFRFGNREFFSTSTISANVWVHIAATYSTSKEIKIYINGVLDATYTGVSAPLSNTNGLYIGTPQDAIANSNYAFSGSIDEVRIWNTTLSADDISRRKNCELQGTESGLVAYYKFNQGTAAGTNTAVTSLTNAKANANNGTLIGFGLTGSTSNWLAGSPVTSGISISTPPSVSTPVTFCRNETASALTATGPNLLWYTEATGGVGSATAPTPNTATAGKTSYWVTSTNATDCESIKVEIVVTINSVAPTVPTAITYEQGATAMPLTATGTNLLWYTAATGGIGDANAPIPSTTTLGSTSYWVSQTIGTCESERAEIVVLVDNLKILPYEAGNAGFYPNASLNNFSSCQVAVSVTSNGGVFDGFGWYQGNYNLYVNGNFVGNYTGVHTQDISSFMPVTSVTAYSTEWTWSWTAVIVNVSSPVSSMPTAGPSVSNLSLCQNAITTPLTAGLTSAGTSLKWYTTINGGGYNATAPTPSSATVGTVSYWVAQANSSGCESERAKIDVTIKAPPAPTITTPMVYCRNETASALTATGTNLLWYTAATGGVGSATAPMPNTATAGSTSYWVSQTVDCESERVEIVVTINSMPPTVSNVTLNIGASTSALTAIGTNLIWYSAATGGTGSTTAPTPSTATLGSTSYWVSQTIGTCESERAEIVVTILNQKTLTYEASKEGGFPEVILNNFPTCQSAVSVTTNGSWFFEDFGLLDGGYNLYVNGNYVGSYYGTETHDISAYMPVTSVGIYTNEDAQSTSVSMTVSVTSSYSSMPTATPSVSNLSLCKNVITTPLTASLTSTGTSLKWYTTVNGGGYSATAPTPSSATAGVVSYWVAQANSNGCESERAKLDVITGDCNEIHTGTAGCYTATLTNVQGNSWFNFISPSGIIASLNPNGMNLGTVTVEVSDASGVVTFNSKKFLGRSVNFMSSNYASGVTMPNNYSLRLYYMDSELTEYNSATSGSYTLPDFNMMWEEGGTGCSLPTYGGTLEGMVGKATVVEAEYGTGNNGFYLQLPLNHFTIFAATTSTNTVLPLELVSFNGYAKNNNNILAWRTEAEQNFSHFELQHGLNGIDFETMGQIKAKGQGSDYGYTHQNPTAATHYYRLKMVDTDGAFKFSQVISLNKNETKSLKIYPNPTKNTISIMTSDYSQPMRLYNINGALLMSKNQTTEQLDISELPTGMYFLHVGSDVLKVIKE